MKKSTKQLLAVGGLLAIIGVAYWAKKKYGVLSMQSLTQTVLGNPVEPQPYIHSERADRTIPYPNQRYGGYIPKYKGWAYDAQAGILDYSTAQSTGSPSGAGGLIGNGGIL